MKQKQVLRGGEWFDSVLIQTFTSGNRDTPYDVVRYVWNGMVKVDTIRADSQYYRDKPPEVRETKAFALCFIDKSGYTHLAMAYPALVDNYIEAMKYRGYRLLDKQEVTFTYPDPAA